MRIVTHGDAMGYFDAAPSGAVSHVSWVMFFGGDMPYAEFRTVKESEMTEYQKRVQEIDNAILCIAEAEKMIRDIGANLVVDMDIPKKPSFNVSRSRTLLMCFRRQII